MYVVYVSFLRDNKSAQTVRQHPSIVLTRVNSVGFAKWLQLLQGKVWMLRICQMPQTFEYLLQEVTKDPARITRTVLPSPVVSTHLAGQ